MLIARWELTCRFGKVDDCVSILRKWEMDVGDRVGWRAAHVRVISGFLGANDSVVELEARAENLTAFEGAWADIERNPHHREYMKQLETVIVPGSSSWKVFREIPLIHE